MPVRRTRNNLLQGYGSFGSLLVGANIPRIVDIGQEAAQIPLPQFLDGPIQTPIVRWIVQINWKFKIKVVDSNPLIRKRYRIQEGFEQFGRYKTRLGEYVTDSGNISYSDIISPCYGCAYIFGDTPSEDRLPCDEPPTSAPLIRIDNGDWTSASLGVVGATTAFGFVLPQPVQAPANFADIYTDASVNAIILGGTFIYTINPYDQSVANDRPETIRINF